MRLLVERVIVGPRSVESACDQAGSRIWCASSTANRGAERMSHQRIQVLGPAQRVISSDGRLTVTIPIKMRSAVSAGSSHRTARPSSSPAFSTR